MTSDAGSSGTANMMFIERSDFSSGYLSQESLVQQKKEVDQIPVSKNIAKDAASNNGTKLNNSSDMSVPPNATSTLPGAKSFLRSRFLKRNNSANATKSELKYKVTTDVDSSGEERLTVTTASPSADASTGFSHLEWSASVPYNLAEEPDQVRGMKHSHSCQSMPSIDLMSSAASSPPAPDNASRQLHQIKEVKSSESLEKVDDTATKSEEKRGGGGDNRKASTASSAGSRVPADVDSSSSDEMPSSVSSSAAVAGASLSSAEESSAAVVVADKAAAAEDNTEKIRRNQEALSKKLDEVRLQSRSTARDGLLIRQRARSADTGKLFPDEFRPRTRLSSEGNDLDCANNVATATDYKKTNSSSEDCVLSAPKLVQEALGSKVARQQQKQQQAPKAPALFSPLPPTILPPPPVEFRDTPETEDKAKNGEKEEADSKSRSEKAKEIQKALENRMKQRPSLDEKIAAAAEEQAKSSFPAKVENSTASLSRIQNKKQALGGDSRGSGGGGYLLIERTGDCLETKSLPRPAPSAK